jgi:hypothetical protein
MLIRALLQFHLDYNDNFKVECPRFWEFNELVRGEAGDLEPPAMHLPA